METFTGMADVVFQRLAWTTAQVTMLIGALWLIQRCLPRLAPAVRCMLWWLVGAQLVLGLVVSSPVTLHWLTPSTQPITAADPLATTRLGNAAIHASANAPILRITPAMHAPPHAVFPWHAACVAAWLLIVTTQLLLLFRPWRESRRLLRGAQPVHDDALHAVCARQARLLGLRDCPPLRRSASIQSPQVIGAWHPVVLLPADRSLDAGETAMALAHELAHIRRGDLWLGWAPALAQRLFFFHPLVRWAVREYALNREAACDALALRHSQLEPGDYGRLLLRLGVSRPLHAGLAGASPTFRNLKRRLLMLEQSRAIAPHARGWLWVAAMALIGVLPYRVTAADATQTAIATVQPLPSLPSLPSLPHMQHMQHMPPMPPMPPIPPVPPPPPSVPPPPAGAHQVDIDIHSDASRGFALADGSTLIVNGNETDSRDIQRLHATASEPVVLYRRDAKRYVVHDKAIIRQARAAYASIAALAAMQGSLAGKQAGLAGAQEGLAARHADLAERQAEVAARSAGIEAKQAALHAMPPSQDRTGQTLSLQGELDGIAQELAEIDREHKDIAQQENLLSSRQADLSKQQAALSAQQTRMQEQISRQMDRVLDEALAKGLARPLDR